TPTVRSTIQCWNIKTKISRRLWRELSNRQTKITTGTSTGRNTDLLLSD
ncbi:jg2563, partial [Pararge aegeria aegeria]